MGGLYKQTDNGCYCLNGMKRMDGMAGIAETAVNAHIRAVPVTDSRDRISGAKNLGPESRARKSCMLGPHASFLTLAA